MPKVTLKRYSHSALSAIEGVGLFIIAIATVVATYHEVVKMLVTREVTLADILLLFIYLEIFAMIAIYVNAHRLPVRMPIYIAMVALARYLILDMKEMDNWQMITVAGAILMLALTVLVHRFGHVRFPYQDSERLNMRDTDAN